MSQKSILSFFKTSNETTSSSETKNKQVTEDSPVKTKRSKRKVQCIESDDESVDSSAKSLNDDSGRKIEDNGNKKPKLSNQSTPKVSAKGKKMNGVSASKRSPKQKKIEEESGSECISKDETNMSESKQECSENDKSEESLSKPSASSDSGQVEFIPKRKTARKQMSSARNSKRNGVLQKVKEESSSKFLDGEKESKSVIATSDNTTSQNDVEMKEIEIPSSTLDVKESPTSCNGMDSEKEPENEKLSCGTEKSADAKHKRKSSKGKSSPVKKSAKTESIHSFFTALKKSEEDKNEKKVDKKGSGKKSKYAGKNEKNVEEESKNDREEDNKTSQKVENDDSPVKRASKRKKKIQGLESDDEHEKNKSMPLEEHVKIEVDDTEENSDKSSEKNKENSSPSEKASISIESKEKSSFCKKSEDADSKSNKEKQKFSVKSTSASGTVYDPSKNHYHPIEDAFWKKDEKVPYLALAKTLELIENTSGRLKTIEILANFLRSVIVLSPDDLLQSVYLCLNRLAPEYEGIELGVGETLLMKAVAQATGRTLDKIKAEVAAKGDLGLVSESSRGNQRVMFAPPKLTVSSVFSKFFEIAKMSGNSVMAKKIDKIQSLFVACRDCEARYIIRSLSGKLRIGLAEQSVLSAIARAAVQTPPVQAYPPEIIDASKKMSSDSFKETVDSQALILKTAYCECPNYDLIIPVLLKEGIAALPDRCQLAPGRPLKPMLAHPTAGIDKVLERFDKNAFTCEFKYDGERAQIHMTDKGDVKIFSRNQEDNTSKYPDVISRISKALKETTKSFILDSEAVAWDKASKQILPFQVLSTRKRKDAVESEIVVQVCIVAFDLLYLNGESLVKKTLKERRDLLHSFFNEVENEFMFAQYKDGNSAETMQEFLDESVKGNCEGLMVKSLEVDASYEIAKRSHNWLKLKKDYLQGIGDTLDLVVIGGYYGKGKRTGNYGGFLLACYDEENEEFQSICKLGTGFKDETLEAHTTFLKQNIIKEPKSYFRYDHNLEPDDWFEPVQVWEIKCADLSISPVHKAAIGIIDPEKGISLRFPRFIRIRDDKTPENATNSVQIADMYQKQQQIQNTSNKNSKVEEDYY